MRYFLFFLLGSLQLFAIQPHEIKKKSIRSLEKKAAKQQNKPLQNALEAQKRLYSRYKNPAISRKNFLQAAYYIETHLPSIKHAKKGYLHKKKTGLKHDIEYDPDSKHCFIVLRNKKAFIGSGVKKKVYKAIHYNHGPKLLARSEQSIEMDLEFKAHKSLQGARGIMNTHAFTTHKRKKTRYYSLYSDLYDGTLHDLFSRKKLTFRNKLIIMSDLLHGLESIHSKDFAHRDLHAYNYLVHAETQGDGSLLWRACIADLGRTIKLRSLKGEVAQMTRRMCAPEAFKFSKLRGSDYQATDIYALGCIFYRLYHNKYPKWQHGYLKSKRISPAKKRKKLIRLLSKETVKRRNSLLHANRPLSTGEKAELVILKMLNVDPKKRPSARALQSELQPLLR